MHFREPLLILLLVTRALAQTDDAQWRALLQKPPAGQSPEPAARQALQLAERFGESDPRLLESLIHLSEILDEEEQGDELKRLVARATKIRPAVAKRVAGARAGEIELAGLLIRLGERASASGAHREARLAQRDALGLREKIFGEQSAAAAETWVALAWTASADGQTDEARGAMNRALELREKAGAGRTLEFAGLLEQSARLYDPGKQFREKEAAYDRAIDLRESLAKPGDPQLAEALTRLGHETRWLASKRIAEKCFRRVVQLQATEGRGAALHRGALNELADLLEDAARVQEAEETYQLAAGLWPEQKLPDTVAIRSLRGLLSLRMRAGRYAEGIAPGERALAGQLTLPVSLAFQRDSLRGELAECHLRAGDVGAAEAHFRALRETTQGPGRFELARAADRLSKAYQDRGDYPKAAEKLEVAIAASEATGGRDRQQVDRMLQLSKLYQAMGRIDDANRMNMAAIGQMGGMVGAEASTNPRLKQALLVGALIVVVGSFFGIVVCGLLFWVVGRKLDQSIAEMFAPPPAVTAAAAETPAPFAPVRFLIPDEAEPAPPEVPPDAAAEAPPAEIVIPAAALEDSVLAGAEPAAVPLAAAPPPAPSHITVYAEGATLFAMRVLNLLLSLLTLGVYSFWGKAKVRRYVFGQIEYLGDRFAFHGHGRELFFGWLRALPALGFVFLFPNILPLAWQSKYSLVAAQLSVFAVIMVLWPIARVGAYRYRITRLSWRGIRFSYRGSALRYLGVTLAGYLLNGLTFGLYYPFLDQRRERLLTGDTYFGTARFQYSGRGGDLFASWLFALPLTYCTIGLAWPWWTALRQRYVWAHTTAPGIRFRSTATGGGLLRLWTGNFFLIVFTLGLGSSWATLRTLDFWSRHVEVTGAPALDDVRQDLQAVSAQAESYADFLGFDFGL